MCISIQGFVTEWAIIACQYKFKSIQKMISKTQENSRTVKKIQEKVRKRSGNVREASRKIKKKIRKIRKAYIQEKTRKVILKNQEHLKI